jgi:hypothetical protein
MVVAPRHLAAFRVEAQDLLAARHRIEQRRVADRKDEVAGREALGSQQPAAEYVGDRPVGLARFEVDAVQLAHRLEQNGVRPRHRSY